MPLICAQMMIGSTIDASGIPPPSGSTPPQYLVRVRVRVRVRVGVRVRVRGLGRRA